MLVKITYTRTKTIESEYYEYVDVGNLEEAASIAEEDLEKLDAYETDGDEPWEQVDENDEFEADWRELSEDEEKYVRENILKTSHKGPQ